MSDIQGLTNALSNPPISSTSIVAPAGPLRIVNTVRLSTVFGNAQITHQSTTYGWVRYVVDRGAAILSLRATRLSGGTSATVKISNNIQSGDVVFERTTVESTRVYIGIISKDGEQTPTHPTRSADLYVHEGDEFYVLYSQATGAGLYTNEEINTSPISIPFTNTGINIGAFQRKVSADAPKWPITNTEIPREVFTNKPVFMPETIPLVFRIGPFRDDIDITGNFSATVQAGNLSGLAMALSSSPSSFNDGNVISSTSGIEAATIQVFVNQTSTATLHSTQAYISGGKYYYLHVFNYYLANNKQLPSSSADRYFGIYLSSTFDNNEIGSLDGSESYAEYVLEGDFVEQRPQSGLSAMQTRALTGLLLALGTSDSGGASSGNATGNDVDGSGTSSNGSGGVVVIGGTPVVGTRSGMSVADHNAAYYANRVSPPSSGYNIKWDSTVGGWVSTGQGKGNEYLASKGL